VGDQNEYGMEWLPLDSILLDAEVGYGCLFDDKYKNQPLVKLLRLSLDLGLEFSLT
jgi:hypothetical protein